MRKIISLPMFCLLSLLTSCGQRPISTSSSKVIKKHDYSEINYAKISYFSIFEQNEDEYYVYFYSPYCIHCSLLKDDIIEFTLSSNIPVYFVEVTEDMEFVDDIFLTIGANEYSKVFAGKTPQLSFIKNHEVYFSIYGNDIDIYLFT